MKKKYLNIFLGILLIFIWGSIIKKHFMKKNPNKVEESVINSNFNITSNNSNLKEDFELVITNNPFKTSRKKSTTNNKKKIQRKRSVKPQKTIRKHKVKFPTIKYYGFVKSKKSTNPLVLLSVSNQLYRKRAGEKFVDVHIIKAYNDSLIVSFQDRIRTIRK